MRCWSTCWPRFPAWRRGGAGPRHRRCPHLRPPRPLVEELLTRKPYPAPKLWLDPGVTDFYAFTTDHLRLEGYQCHELGEKIPVAI